jgi:hypothetical protein
MRKIHQNVWGMPFDDDVSDDFRLNTAELILRGDDRARGAVPKESKAVTVGIDVGKWSLHWIAMAWSGDGSPHTIDYGVRDVHSRDMDTEVALDAAMRSLAEEIDGGFGPTGAPVVPDAVWIDSGYKASIVYRVAMDRPRMWMAVKGFGWGQDSIRYRTVKRSKSVRIVGENYHIVRLAARDAGFASGGPVNLAHVNADYWKSYLHERLATPRDEPGAMSMFKARPVEHLSLVKHWLAEQEETEFVAGRGDVKVWKRKSKQNHWLDASMMACAAAHYVGVRQDVVKRQAQVAKGGWFAQRDDRRQRPDERKRR